MSVRVSCLDDFWSSTDLHSKEAPPRKEVHTCTQKTTATAHSTSISQYEFRWYTNAESIAKDLAVWNAQIPCRICENEEDFVQVKLIMEVVKGDMLEDGTVSELDLKLAGLVPSEPVFPFAKVQENWEEMKQHSDDISGTLLPEELIRAGRAEDIRW